MCIEQAIEVSKGLLTPLIAIIATYIACQQWKTNQQKLKLEKYDRRLHVYEEVKKILSIILRDANASADDLLRFRTSVSEVDFLFGSEIIEYIDEIYTRGLKLRRCNREHRDCIQTKLKDNNHNKIVEEIDKELTWLTEQFDPAKEKFRKYLDLSE